MARLRRYRSLRAAFYHLKPGHIAEIYAPVSHVEGPVIFRAERRKGSAIFGRILSPRGLGERRAVLKEFFTGYAAHPELILLALPVTVAAERYKGATYAIQFRVSKLSPSRYARYLARALALSLYTDLPIMDTTVDNAPHDIWADTPPPNVDPLASTAAFIDLASLPSARGLGEDFHAKALKYLRRYLSRDGLWSLEDLKKDLFRTWASLSALGYRVRRLDPHTLLLRFYQREGRIREF